MLRDELLELAVSFLLSDSLFCVVVCDSSTRSAFCKKEKKVWINTKFWIFKQKLNTIESIADLVKYEIRVLMAKSSD